MSSENGSLCICIKYDGEIIIDENVALTEYQGSDY